MPAQCIWKIGCTSFASDGAAAPASHGSPASTPIGAPPQAASAITATRRPRTALSEPIAEPVVEPIVDRAAHPPRAILHAALILRALRARVAEQLAGRRACSMDDAREARIAPGAGVAHAPLPERRL